MVYITREDLETVYKLIKEEKVELCGHLLTENELSEYNIEKPLENGETLLYIEVVGEESSCQNKSFTRYQWHTHSIRSKGYPSASDIFIPLRKRPEICFVFTIWGIWELKAGKKYNLSEREREKIKVEYIDKILAKIYNYTERGRAEILNPQQLSAVKQLTESLNKVVIKLGMELNVKFTAWWELEGDYWFN